MTSAASAEPLPAGAVSMDLPKKDAPSYTHEWNHGQDSSGGRVTAHLLSYSERRKR